MRKSLLLTTTLFAFFCLNAQKPEISEVKRNMSMGERTGYKIQLPNQEINRVEKINKEYLKSLNAEGMKMPKNANESGFRKFYLKGTEQPLMLIISMEQEGKNVGWTGYFLMEKDSSIYNQNEQIQAFLYTIYNRSMYQLYEDSIFFQEKMVKEARGNQKGENKDAEKNRKSINKAKDNIREAESIIEKSNASIKSLSSKLEELTDKKNKTKAVQKDAEKEMDKVENFGKEVKEELSKLKKMNKNLSDLQKDPATNANLIVAQTNDIDLLTKAMEQKQSEYKQKYDAAKSALKSAEKEADASEDNLKDAEKGIKKANDNIATANKEITNMRKEIEENQKVLDNFENEQKSKLEEAVKIQEKRLEELKTAQSAYK